MYDLNKIWDYIKWGPVSIDMITMITNDKYDKYVHTTFSINMITIDIIMYLRYVWVVLFVVGQSVLSENDTNVQIGR